jgi:polysaccharide pyruvyl transferase WcaK-like protein
MKIIHFHFKYNHNKGDKAIVLAIRKLLKDTFPEIDYTSKYLYYLKDNPYPKVVDNKPIKKLRKNSLYQKIARFIPKAVSSLLESSLFTLKKQNKKRLIKYINSHQIMVIGGGGVFSKNTLPFDAEIISQIKIPIAIFSAGFNKTVGQNFPTKEDRESIRKLLDQSSLISVRDTNTFDTLKYLTNKEIVKIPDPAIFLNPEKDTQKKATDTINLGINLAMHNDLAKRASLEIIYPELKKFLLSISLEKKINLYYFKHALPEDEIVDKIKTLNINLKVIDEDVNDMYKYYAKMDYFIGMMLHSTILAYSQRVPFINIGYDVKNKSFLSDINYLEGYLDPNDRDFNVQKIIDKFRFLQQNEYNIRDLFTKNILSQEIALNKFLEKLKTLA